MSTITLSPYVECPECGGTGEIFPRATCGMWAGLVPWPDDIGAEPCGFCEGRGEVAADEVAWYEAAIAEAFAEFEGETAGTPDAPQPELQEVRPDPYQQPVAVTMAQSDPIRIWAADGFRLELYDTHRFDRDGRPELAYRLYDRDSLIFAGDEFRPSPLHAVDSDETVAALLDFLSLRPGDTDDEYFAQYTARQSAWVVARAKDLQLAGFGMQDQ